MSQIKTQRMGRILAAGSKEKIDEVLAVSYTHLTLPTIYSV